jgi:uncharacterized protein YndB with AHSA1/START domain
MIIEDSIEINAPPVKVYEWLIQRFESSENYRAWHPEHVSVHWIKGSSTQGGSVLYVKEYLHGKLHKLKLIITKIEPNLRIEYRLFFPASLFILKNDFIFTSKGKGTSVFTATSTLRGGSFIERLFKQRIQALKHHMKEEGENIKAALEAGSNRCTTGQVLAGHHRRKR